MDKIMQNKRDLKTSEQSLFRLKKKFIKVPSLLMYYLTKLDDVIKSGF